MRKKFKILLIGLLSLMILVTIPLIHFERGAMINNGNLITIVTNLPKGIKKVKINTTWEGYIDLYMEGNTNIKYYSPRQDIENSRKVRVVKTEYLKGAESKVGFYNYAVVFEVYDARTGEYLTAASDFSNKRK